MSKADDKILDGLTAECNELILRVTGLIAERDALAAIVRETATILPTLLRDSDVAGRELGPSMGYDVFIPRCDRLRDRIAAAGFELAPVDCWDDVPDPTAGGAP